MRRFLPACCCLAIVLPAAAQPINVDDPPKGVFSDDWYAIMLNDQKSGHMHSTMERRKGRGGVDIIRTSTEMVMTAGRGDVNITVTVSQQSEETIDGKPLGFSNTQKLGFMPSTTRGVIENGKVKITTSQFGQQSTTTTVDLPEGAMMSWAVYREQLKRGLKPGTKYTLPMYEPSMAADKLSEATIEVFEPEDIDLFGRKVQAIRTKQTMNVPGLLGNTPVETTSWVKEDGTPVKLVMTMMNIPIEIIACSKPVALAKDSPAEIMSGTLIELPEPLDEDAATITYRLSWAKGSGSEVPTTTMQKVERRSPRELIVTVSRASVAVAQTPATPLSAEEKEKCTAASPMLNYNDSEVARVAKEAAGDEKDPRRLAERLTKFVGEYVREKNLSVGFATASEVARSREGDCTEHGVLLAALGRAVGIPTRIVTGVVYADRFGARRNVFVGHLWTQFYLDGRWVDFDPALGETDVRPTHIAIGVSPATDTGLADMVGGQWLSMHDLKIEVVKPNDEKTARPQEK